MSEPRRIYLDSSILLAHLLRESERPEKLAWSKLDGERITSELAELECRRTLDRIRLQERIHDEEIADRFAEIDLLFQSLRVIQFNAPILKRAKTSFPTAVRSLDAIHLATAELAQSTLFLTFDKQQAIAAKAIGLNVSP